jgi:hypothetical protein
MHLTQRLRPPLFRNMILRGKKDQSRSQHYPILDTHFVCCLYTAIAVHAESILIPERTFPEQIDFIMPEKVTRDEVV